ncbi:unnamed protein product [Phytophthora fragariaefolia]|uniref:Unnamed protein product n=1 Tax=Phytophthora fragariaefolia TaxID=1490495 RepID=A0A9W7CT85_9STRA|nr:unnamed protein product [Phytophthora fragariaefolia]
MPPHHHHRLRSLSIPPTGYSDQKLNEPSAAGPVYPSNTNSQATADAPTTVDSSDASTTADTSTSNTDSSASAPASTPSVATNSSSSDNSKLCAKPRVRITEVDIGVTVDANEDEVNLKVVAISAPPSGGSRIAFHSGGDVIVRELDETDNLVSSSTVVNVPLHDFGNIYADNDGFVLLGTRDAEGGGTLNCGNPSNLCGTAPNPAVPCYVMYLVRYDGSKETWVTKLTSSSSSLPPYSSLGSGPDVYMIWWYAHHGRIASDGTNWAAYFGCAISTSEGGCINIHRGDLMKVVGLPGRLQLKLTPSTGVARTWATSVSHSRSSSKKYWATVSNGEGDNAKVHFIHFAINAAADDDITLGGTDANERAPHLAEIGDGGLLAMWEVGSTGGDLADGGDRTVYAQVLDASTGEAISSKVTVDKSVVGNRYHALKTFPDGSVAYLSKGTTDTSVQVVRFFGC